MSSQGFSPRWAAAGADAEREFGPGEDRDQKQESAVLWNMLAVDSSDEANEALSEASRSAKRSIWRNASTHANNPKGAGTCSIRQVTAMATA